MKRVNVFTTGIYNGSAASLFWAEFSTVILLISSSCCRADAVAD